MKWFEPIIAICAISLVVLPIILKVIRRKKGESNCSGACCCCEKRNDCLKNFIEYVKKETTNK